jgi:hypothetical protein
LQQRVFKGYTYKMSQNKKSQDKTSGFKTSQIRKVPSYKTTQASKLQNIPNTKHPKPQNIPHTNNLRYMTDCVANTCFTQTMTAIHTSILPVKKQYVANRKLVSITLKQW